MKLYLTKFMRHVELVYNSNNSCLNHNIKRNGLNYIFVTHLTRNLQVDHPTQKNYGQMILAHIIC